MQVLVLEGLALVAVVGDRYLCHAHFLGRSPVARQNQLVLLQVPGKAQAVEIWQSFGMLEAWLLML